MKSERARRSQAGEARWLGAICAKPVGRGDIVRMLIATLKSRDMNAGQIAWADAVHAWRAAPAMRAPWDA